MKFYIFIMININLKRFVNYKNIKLNIIFITIAESAVYRPPNYKTDDHEYDPCIFNLQL